MATNTRLTHELAVQLLRQQAVGCPNCGKAILRPRYPHKKQHVEYRCGECGEIYHPCKLIGTSDSVASVKDLDDDKRHTRTVGRK